MNNLGSRIKVPVLSKCQRYIHLEWSIPDHVSCIVINRQDQIVILVLIHKLQSF